MLDIFRNVPERSIQLRIAEGIPSAGKQGQLAVAEQPHCSCKPSFFAADATAQHLNFAHFFRQYGNVPVIVPKIRFPDDKSLYRHMLCHSC